jgi:hypothetical protein
MMNLDEAHKRAVADWVARGQKLAEIQKRLADELGVGLTYMEVRLLVDDLKLTLKDAEPPKPLGGSGKIAATGADAPQEALAENEDAAETRPEEEMPPVGARNVSVKVDQLARPGALVSGGVTFSDGNTATWYLDQFGRLAMAPEQQGYKPPAADLQMFQMQLQKELAKMGF